MMIICFTLVFIGFVSLSLAMKRHLLQIQPWFLPIKMQGSLASKKQIIIFSLVGYSTLISAGILSMAVNGVAIGLVYWTGLLTLATLLQSLLLTYRPQWILPLSLMSLPVSALLGVTS